VVSEFCFTAFLTYFFQRTKALLFTFFEFLRTSLRTTYACR